MAGRLIFNQRFSLRRTRKWKRGLAARRDGVTAAVITLNMPPGWPIRGLPQTLECGQWHDIRSHFYHVCSFWGRCWLKGGGRGGDTGLRWSDDPHSLSNAIHVATANH